MRSEKIRAGLVCLAACTALLTEVAHADRRTGLGGNLLIQDPDDLFPFPQYALKHRNMIRLDYGPPVGGETNRGNGVLTLGNDKNAFGVALHRGDLLSPQVVGFNTELAWLGGVGNPFGNTSASAFAAPALVLSNPPAGAATTTLPATVADLIYARALGATDSLGIRFGFGRGIQAVKTDDALTKGSSTFFVAQFGYSMAPPEGLRLDISGNVLAAFGKAVVADDTTNKGFDLRLGALGRGYYALNQLVDLGFLAALSVDNEHTKNTALKSNDFSTSLMAGVGPAVHIKRAQIAAYGGFQMGAGKNVPTSDDGSQDVSRLNFLAPMVNMAVEVQVLDWLYVRTAAQYIWQLERYKGTDADGDRKERRSNAPFAWSLGLGIKKNNFYFDGVVQNALVTNGPTFIGGSANGFLAIASATYKFGDVFSGQGEPGYGPYDEAAQAEAAPHAPEPAPAAEATAPVAEPRTGAFDSTRPEAAPETNGDASLSPGSESAEGSAAGSLSL